VCSVLMGGFGLGLVSHLTNNSQSQVWFFVGVIILTFLFDSGGLVVVVLAGALGLFGWGWRVFFFFVCFFLFFFFFFFFFFEPVSHSAHPTFPVFPSTPIQPLLA